MIIGAEDNQQTQDSTLSCTLCPVSVCGAKVMELQSNMRPKFEIQAVLQL